MKINKTRLQYSSNKTVEPSVAENLIIYFLTKNNVKFEREVSFKGFTTLNGGHYRYDFYFPQSNLILEYDGKLYHKNKKNDNIKNIFCRNNGMKIIRFNSKHYYHLDTELQKLIKQYKLKR